MMKYALIPTCREFNSWQVGKRASFPGCWAPELMRGAARVAPERDTICRRSNLRQIGIICAVSAALLATPVQAHVTAQPDSAVAGSYFELNFRVPHGCSGAPTTALRLKVPEGVLSVKPQAKPGWTITLKSRKVEPPIKTDHGAVIDETVDQINWEGGSLSQAHYDTFSILMKLPDAPGQILYFPVVQECQQGIHRWIEIPAAGQNRKDLREPAPAVKLTPKAP